MAFLWDFYATLKTKVTLSDWWHCFATWTRV